jgi:hypothetical protein
MKIRIGNCIVRFEVFTAVTVKNAVFWDVTPHSVTTQMTAAFIATVLKPSNLTQH